MKKQACPQWKHSFVFNGLTASQLRQSSLELTVWDQAAFGLNDRLLGGARLGSSKSVMSPCGFLGPLGNPPTPSLASLGSAHWLWLATIHAPQASRCHQASQQFKSG